jgi:hypothetical protein
MVPLSTPRPLFLKVKVRVTVVLRRVLGRVKVLATARLPPAPTPLTRILSIGRLRSLLRISSRCETRPICVGANWIVNDAFSPLSKLKANELPAEGVTLNGLVRLLSSTSPSNVPLPTLRMVRLLLAGFRPMPVTGNMTTRGTIAILAPLGVGVAVGVSVAVAVDVDMAVAVAVGVAVTVAV